MIQRILRGQWLYLVLAAIVMVIYARGMPALAPIVLEEPEDHAALQEQAVELWPKELDAHGLTEATRRHPVLGMVLTLLTLLMGMLIAGGLAYSWWHVLTGKVRTIWGFASKKLPAWTFAELGRIMALMIIAFSLLPLLRFAPFIEVWGPPTTSPVWIPLTMLCLDAFRGYLVIFPFLLLTLFLTVEIIRFFNLKPPIEPIQALLFQQRDPAVIILLVVLSCVIAPVAEELFFRGVVFAAIRHKTTRGWAIFLSGAAFSLVHTNVVGFLPIMLIGMFLSYIYERTGSLVAPIAVHIVHNTFLLALGLTVRRLLLD